MELQNNFDNGSIGVEITPANSGTSGDAFNTAHDCYYDNAQTFLGAAAARIDASQSDYLENGQLEWTLSPTPRSAFLRAAVFIPTEWGIASGIAEFTTSVQVILGGTVLRVVYWDTESPPLRLLLIASTEVFFTTVPPRNAWFRLELAWQDGLAEARLALDPFGIHDEAQTSDGPTADMDKALLAHGCCDVGDDVYVDQVDVSQTDWLGPYANLGGGSPPSGATQAIRKPPR